MLLFLFLCTISPWTCAQPSPLTSTTTDKALCFLCYQSSQFHFPPISVPYTLCQSCSAMPKPELPLTLITGQCRDAGLGCRLKKKQSLSLPFVWPTSQNKAALSYQTFFCKNNSFSLLQSGIQDDPFPVTGTVLYADIGVGPRSHALSFSLVWLISTGVP